MNSILLWTDAHCNVSNSNFQFQSNFKSWDFAEDFTQSMAKYYDFATCLRFFLLIRVIIAKARKSIWACQSNKIVGSEQFLLSIIRWKHHLRYKRGAVRFFPLNTDESNLMFRGVNFRVVSLEVGDVVIERFEGRILAKLRLLSKLGGLTTAII